MYNKIFTKILDSSIWLEPTPTRIVWLTMLAAMDEDGFCQFASVPNLAHRAILSLPETTKAVCVLESPDENSSDPDNEGRRIEKVPGGWMVLNAIKYRDMVTRSVIQEQTRRRVAAHRERKKSNAPVTRGNGKTIKCNAPVTQSEADTDTDTEAKREMPLRAETDPLLLRVFALYRRRSSTVLDSKEKKAFAALSLDEEDLTALETAWKKKWRHHRQGILTLFNNWNEEIERAKNYLTEIKANGTPNSRNHPGSTFTVFRDAPEREATAHITGELFRQVPNDGK